MNIWICFPLLRCEREQEIILQHKESGEGIDDPRLLNFFLHRFREFHAARYRVPKFFWSGIGKDIHPLFE